MSLAAAIFCVHLALTGFGINISILRRGANVGRLGANVVTVGKLKQAVSTQLYGIALEDIALQ